MNEMPQNVLRTRKKAQWIFAALAGLLLLASIAGGGKLPGALLPVWVAAVLAYLLLPLSRALEERCSPTGGALLALGLLALAVAGLLIWVLPLILAQAATLEAQLPTLVQNAQAWLRGGQGVAGWIPFAEDLANWLPDAAAQLTPLLRGLGSATDHLAEWVTLAFTALFFTFFFLKDRVRFQNTLAYALPSRWRPTAQAMARGIQGILGRFLRAQGLVALASGTLTTVGYLLVGTPYALLMGLLMTIACMIPYIGPVIGLLPAAAFSLTAGPDRLVFTLLVVLVVQGVLGSVLAPRVIDDQVGLHPVYMLSALLAGSAVWGIWGALLGIPIALCLRVIARECRIGAVRARPRASTEIEPAKPDAPDGCGERAG